MAKKRLVVGYVRVSTGMAKQDTSVEGQTWVLTEQLKCDRVITERLGASSGRRRPGWDELRSLVASGRVERVIVSDLSRLARDGTDQQFLEECHLVGTMVVDVHGVEYENHTVGGLLTSGVLSLVNRAQSRITGLKVAEGNRRRRAAGLYGRPQVPFGYGYEAGHFIRHPENWVHARWLIEELLRRDLNIYGTLRGLPPDFPRRFSRLGLRKWLYNPILRGGVGLGWDDRKSRYESVVWGQAPPMVSPAEWDTISRALEVRRRTRGTKTGHQTHLFTGLLVCNGCQTNLWWAASKARPTPRYQCCNLQCRKHGHGIREEVLLAEVKRELAKQAAEMARHAAEHVHGNRQPTRRELEVRDKLERLEQLQAEGLGGIDSVIRQLRRELDSAAGSDGLTRAAYQQLFETPETFDLALSDELRALLVTFVDRIDFYGDQRFTVRMRSAGSIES